MEKSCRNYFEIIILKEGYQKTLKRYGIEILSIDRALSNIFMEKSCRNYFEIIILKEGYQKALKKVKLIKGFQLNLFQ